jgi:hypothetical protein
VTRFILGVGLAAGMATTLPVASISTAGATPVMAGHHNGPGNGGSGWGFGHHHSRSVSVSGTVSSTNSGGFVLTVAQLGHMRTAQPWHTLTSTSTTVTVDVTTGTFYREPGQSTPGLGGVMVGDKVEVTGTPSGTATITASLVVVPLATDAGMVATTSSGGFTLTVEEGWGALTKTSTTIDVTVTSTTIYREPGQSTPGLGGVMVGDNVEVAGPQGGAGALTALVVVVPLVTDIGTVSSPSSGGFTLTTAKSTTVTVDLSATTTKFRERGVSSPGPTNILTGDTVTVTGTQAGATTVDALLVVIGTGGHGHHHGHGNNGGGYGGGQGGPGHHGRK